MKVHEMELIPRLSWKKIAKFIDNSKSIASEYQEPND